MIKKLIATGSMLALIIVGGIAVYQNAKQSTHGGKDKLTVVASFYPLYDFTRQVGGDKVSVTNMTPPGAEPHDYEPSPKELIRAHEADVLVYNGAQLEPWITSFLADYTQTTIRASDGIDVHESSDDHHEDDGHDHSASATTDPHFWLDPVLAQQIVETIRDGLVRADPENAEYYTANADAYTQKLAELDRSFASGLAECKIDTAISSHGAFSYIARRYDFRVESIAGIEPDEEPSVAKMAELTNVVKQKGIQYVFFESLVSPRLAETIAKEAGVKTLVFDPIEGLSKADQDKGRDYISVQYDNLKNLRTALACS
jgi:zinc transport system substrate-binding protein